MKQIWHSKREMIIYWTCFCQSALSNLTLDTEHDILSYDILSYIVYMASCLDTEKQWQFAGLLWEPLKEWVVSLMSTFCMIFPCRWAGKLKKKGGGTTKFRANHSNYLATSPWSMTTKESLWPLNSLKWFEKQRCWFRSGCQYPSLNSWTWFKGVLSSQVVLPFITLEHLVKQQGPVREHSAICSTHIFLQPNCTCKGETETRWFQNKQALSGLWFMQ